MRKAILALGMIVFLGGLLAWKGAAIPPLTKQVPAGTPEPTNQRVLATYGKLPLSFEANQGQTDPQVKFLSRGRGYSLFLTSTEAVLSLISPQGAPSAQRDNSASDSAPLVSSAVSPPKQESAVLRMGLVGANPEPQVVGLDELPGKSNYFIGNDPKKWRTNVPTYRKVAYQEVYPGIDLVYYGTDQRQLEYDFIVAPGADPKAITLHFEGAESIELDAQGNLLLHLSEGKVRVRKPDIYQKGAGAQQEISGTFVLEGKNGVGFEVAAYDVDKPLIIDPVLVYSTYLGGAERDEAVAIAVDDSGNVYVTGFTLTFTGSSSFPTESPIQPTFGGGFSDAFVSKLSTDGSTLLYSSFLGGSGGEQGSSIALDASGNAYVTGFTLSAEFPTTAGAFQQSTPEGCSSFPDGYIPFTQMYSTSAPNAAGDRLVVGQMSLEAFNTLQTISLPSTVNETFCGLVELAPGSFFGAYVPTAAERLGDFSSFGVPPIDPLTGLPFPGNIIPAFRLPDPYAWRIFTPSPRGDVFVAKIGPEFIEVTIDIKPGSDPNAINPADSGLTPVAILTTDTFDATTVSPITVQFGPAEASLEHQLGHLKDVDGDGDLDLVLHFPTQATGIQCGDSEASLSGETFGGQAIQGSDSVVTVGCT